MKLPLELLEEIVLLMDFKKVVELFPKIAHHVYDPEEYINNLSSGYTREAKRNVMDLAAMNGHLEVVKWLHHNRTEGCTKCAMHYAARNGYLQIVKWLHLNRTEGCTYDAMDYAAKNGHI